MYVCACSVHDGINALSPASRRSGKPICAALRLSQSLPSVVFKTVPTLVDGGLFFFFFNCQVVCVRILASVFVFPEVL